MGLFLFSPMYLFWSRTFLIESTAIFFASAYLALSLEFFSAKEFAPKKALAVMALGVIAGTVKVTTGFAFFGLAGLAFLFHAGSDAHKRTAARRRFFELFFAFVLPGIATIAWVKYSDAQKALNPLADFIRSDNLTSWNFGTLPQRFSGDFWNMIFRLTIHDAIGHRTTWILSLIGIPFIAKRNRWLALLCGVAFIAVPLVFTNLHIVHNYYWMANGIFLVMYLAFVVDGFLDSPRQLKRWIGIVFLFVAGFLCTRQFYHHGYFLQKAENYAYSDLEKPLASFMKEKDVAVIFGADWFPAVAYGAKQRALMFRESVSNPGDSLLSADDFLRAIERVKASGHAVGAVLICGNWMAPNGILERLRAYLPLAERPFYSGSCHVFKLN